MITSDEDKPDWFLGGLPFDSDSCRPVQHHQSRSLFIEILLFMLMVKVATHGHIPKPLAAVVDVAVAVVVDVVLEEHVTAAPLAACLKTLTLTS